MRTSIARKFIVLDHLDVSVPIDVDDIFLPTLTAILLVFSLDIGFDLIIFVRNVFVNHHPTSSPIDFVPAFQMTTWPRSCFLFFSCRTPDHLDTTDLASLCDTFAGLKAPFYTQLRAQIDDLRNLVEVRLRLRRRTGVR